MMDIYRRFVSYSPTAVENVTMNQVLSMVS